MTLSIGVVTNQFQDFDHTGQISELAAEMKPYAKSIPGSVYVVDRRHQLPTLETASARDAERLADPALYNGARPGDMESLQRQYAEAETALERAEALWVRAAERLDAAT